MSDVARSMPIQRLSGEGSCVVLTFDDGPDMEWTPRILDLLASGNACALFFVVGCRMRGAEPLIRRMQSEGHEIANHSWSHRHPWTLSSRVARAEVRDGAAAISDVTGLAPRFFRPPHGRVRQCMVDEADELLEATMLWSLSAMDWGPWGHAKEIAARISRVSSSDIVLMHDAENTHNKPGELMKVIPGFLALLAAKRLQPIVPA